MDTTHQVEVLLEEWRAGSINARDALFKRVESRLMRLIRKVLAPHDRLRKVLESQDVFQNASVKLLKSLDSECPATTSKVFRTFGDSDSPYGN